MTSKILKSLILVTVFAIIFVLKLFTEPKITLSSTTKGIITPYASRLVKEINKKNIKSPNKYTLYTANFEEKDTIPIPNSETKNILWLGSNSQVPTQNLDKYDIILASHPYLINFLHTSNLNAFYFPVYGTPSNQVNSNKHIALIGDNRLIEEILQENKIFYYKYQLTDTTKIKKDMTNFKAVFINNAKFSNNTLDIHPIILDIVLADIPLATQYTGYIDINPLHIFNNFINYYMNKDDAQRLVGKLILNPVPQEFTVKSQKALNYVKTHQSLQSSVINLKNIIENNSEIKSTINNNSINIDIPTAVGHIGAGDYWLATDLNQAFETFGYTTSQTYFNSYIKNPVKTNILISGFLPIYKDTSRDYIGENNILYVAYAQFSQTEDKELVENKETYINNIIRISQNKQIKAVVLASEELTKELNKHNVNAYYIPQFTNTKRFYPDYDESLKSEVFFVGVNSFYRQAAPTLLEADLPITIYGPGWKTAKAPYLDNNILRKHYSSAKIVLNDTREGMKEFGFISNRIFDATACEALIISDYMPEIEEIYGDTVPMYKTKEELISLVKYYLDDKNQAERKDKAKRAREITLKNFTSEKAAIKFQQIFDHISQK